MNPRINLLIGFILAVLIVFPPVTSTTVFAQGKKAKSGEVKAQKSRGEGKDENIKSKSDVNILKALPEAPPSKGGKKTRGAPMGVLTFDNYTPYKIQLFANGDYIGLLPAWGKVYTVSTEGNLVLYARADFDDGSSLTWGPTVITMTPAGYTWNLKQ